MDLILKKKNLQSYFPSPKKCPLQNALNFKELTSRVECCRVREMTTDTLRLCYFPTLNLVFSHPFQGAAVVYKSHN